MRLPPVGLFQLKAAATPGNQNATPYTGVPTSSKYYGLLVPNASACPGMAGSVSLDALLQSNETGGVRNVTSHEKADVARRDGLVPLSATDAQALKVLSQYEVDHYIALIEGGRNSTPDNTPDAVPAKSADYLKNLWAQPLSQARIKDVTEVHGRMYIKAMAAQGRGAEALATLRRTDLNWIEKAVQFIDPFLVNLGKTNPAAQVQLLKDVASEMQASGNNNLAAAAFHELARIHTPKANRAPAAKGTPEAFMADSLEVRAVAPTPDYAALAKQCEERAKGSDLD